ncbi:MAG: hypothetical protein ACYDA0_13250 [Candidatus Dormibacteraceae bacterium]
MNQQAAPPTTYYWRGALWLSPGEVIQPGNWGKVIFAFGVRHNLFFREYVYERVRATEFAVQPSHMRSASAFRDEAVARAFDQAAAPLLYRVQLVAGAHTATLDMQWLDVGSGARDGHGWLVSP